MINMGMRHKHIINRCRVNRYLLIHIQIRPLFHTTVHQKMSLPKCHIMAASRHLTVCPKNSIFIKTTPFHPAVLVILHINFTISEQILCN